MYRLALCLVATLFVASCVPTLYPSPAPAPTAQRPAPSVRPKPAPPPVSASVAARNFAQVVARVEPVAERMCRARTTGLDCDYLIKIDERRDQPANAYQMRDRNDRPVIVFTQSLIQDTRNTDELAFIMGHEAAHHIKNHIPRQEQQAMGGALIGSILAAALGVDAREGGNLGAKVGSRTYSKEYELEADALGTEIAFRAGFDPVRGARYFERIPDPGDRFLGSHPPNAQRMETVRRTAAGLRR